MKIQAEKMLLVVALLVLATGTGVSDGVLINKCQLRDQINQILPANTMGRVNKVAKIVCHLQLSTGLDSRAISQITAPAVYTSPVGHRNSVPGLSSEESFENLIPTPNSRLTGSAGKKNDAVTNPKPNDPKREGGHGGRRGRSVSVSSSEESTENGTKRSKSFHDASPNNFTSKHHSTEAHYTRPFPQNGSHATNATRNNGTGGGHGIQNPKHPKPEKGRGHGERPGRSLHDSIEESGQEDLWTLYGLFQLPDRIACSSRSEQSLNLCNLNCSKLIDDDISDDLACFGTIIRRVMPGGRRHGPTDELVKIYYAGLFQKQCKNVVASKYFSTC